MRAHPAAKAIAFVLLATVWGTLWSTVWCSAALAQFDIEPVLPDKRGRTVLYTTEYLDVGELQSILYLLDAEIVTKPSLNIVAARSEDEGVLKTIEEIIATLDVPEMPVPNIELSALILTMSEAADSSDNVVLEPIAADLLRLFGHRNFTVLDTLFLQIGDGSNGRVEGSFDDGQAAIPIGYQFAIDSVRILPGEGQKRIRLETLTFEVTGENATGVRRALLRTDVEVPDGRRMVVGKATPRGGGLDTLVVVVQATVQNL